jgi:hypothetical protein
MNCIESKVCPHGQLRGQSRNDGGIIHFFVEFLSGPVIELYGGRAQDNLTVHPSTPRSHCVHQQCQNYLSGHHSELVTIIPINGSRAMKIRDLSIHNFRGFRHFDMNDLGRVNLIVGTNNCGKTTALEAVNILMANGDVSALWSTLVRRGEEIWIERELAPASSGRQVEIRRLFRGHEIEVGTSFRISSDMHNGGMKMTAKVEEYRESQGELFETEPSPPLKPRRNSFHP